MNYFIYVLIFPSYFCSILQFFLPSIISYKIFASIVANIAFIIFIFNLMKNRFKIPKVLLGSLGIYTFIIMIYGFLTPAVYNENPAPIYNGHLLVIIGQILPAILLIPFIAKNEIIQIKIKCIAPIIGLLFSAISLLSVLYPNSITSGLADNENGMNYQVISYVAAYSSALIEYYMLTYKNDIYRGIWQKKIGIVLGIIVLFINLTTILLSGGRGGFVTFILFTTITFLLMINKGKITIKKILFFIVSLIIIIAGCWLAYTYAQKHLVEQRV